HRLGAALGEIDDGEPAVGENPVLARTLVVSARVGAAVAHHAAQRFDLGPRPLYRLMVDVVVAEYSAHKREVGNAARLVERGVDGVTRDGAVSRLHEAPARDGLVRRIPAPVGFPGHGP